jgi:hypothetical protein
MPARIPYHVKGDVLHHHAFGKTTVFYSQHAATAHADDAGTTPAFVVAEGESLDNVPEMTEGEANPQNYGEAKPVNAPAKKTKR